TDTLDDRLLDLLANPNLCSRKKLFNSVDDRVSSDVLFPGQCDAALLRIKSLESVRGERPTRAIATALRGNTLYSSIDPYLGGVHAVAEAMRALSATAAQPAAVGQGLFYGSLSDYKQRSEFSEGVRGLSDACRSWHIPIVAESVDFRANTSAGTVLPTPAVYMVGVCSDITKVRPMHFDEREDVIFVLGASRNEIATSEYETFLKDRVTPPPPDIDFAFERKVCDLVCELLNDELLKSAHSITAGGIALGICEASLLRAKPIGARLKIFPREGASPEVLLFGESSGRFVISLAEQHRERVTATCSKFGIPLLAEGRVGGREITFEEGAKCSIPLSSAAHIFGGGLDHLMSGG
ncbi:MAG: hypothetical protein IT290_01310, partial [Deltaproteobacteria bacterium]|nr:hypothetical protein [Deltaproteobacteria bacterium]